MLKRFILIALKGDIVGYTMKSTKWLKSDILIKRPIEL